MSWNIRRWLPLIVWIVMIFGLSSIPVVVAPGDMRLPVGFDKIIHFIEYSVFAMLFYRGLSYGGVRIRWSIVIIVITSGVAVGALDEMYQSYIPRRDSSFYDLVTDSAGVVVGTFVAVLRHIIQISKASVRKAGLG